MNPWTDAELAYEWQVRFTERLGILCGTDTPTPEQELIARTEADAAVRELKEQPANPPRKRE